MNATRTGLRSLAVSLALALGLASWAPELRAQATENAEDFKIQWLKFCEFALVRAADKKKAKVCLVHYEQRAADSGSVLVSAAIRQIEGQEKERFIVMVPLGVAIPAGLKIRVDDQTPIALRYTLCHPQGCTAEGNAPKEFVQALKKGSKLTVAAINAFGRGFTLPVSLSGFTKTYNGEPRDAKEVEAIRLKEFQTLQALFKAQKEKAAPPKTKPKPNN